MSAKIALKLKFEQITRRLTIPIEKLHFEGLKKLVSELFQENQIPNSFHFVYRDQDGDLITVSSQLELDEALRATSSSSLLRLDILPSTTKQENHNPNANSSPCQGFFKRAHFWALHQKALRAFEVGDYSEAKVLLQKQVELVPNNPIANYNLACAHSRLGEVSEALFYLKQAVSFGYSNVSHIKSDDDLEILRGHPEFEGLVSSLQKQEEGQEKVSERACGRRGWGRASCGPCGPRFARCNTLNTEEKQASSNSVSKEEEQVIPAQVISVPEKTIQEEKPKEEERPAKKEEEQVISYPVLSPEPKQEKPLNEFEQKLKQLEDMGFLNREENIAALVNASGDIVRAITRLLSA